MIDIFREELVKLFGNKFKINVIINFEGKNYGFAMPTYLDPCTSLSKWPILISNKDGSEISFTYDEEEILSKDIVKGKKIYQCSYMYSLS